MYSVDLKSIQPSKQSEINGEYCKMRYTHIIW